MSPVLNLLFTAPLKVLMIGLFYSVELFSVFCHPSIFKTVCLNQAHGEAAVYPSCPLVTGVVHHWKGHQFVTEPT